MGEGGYRKKQKYLVLRGSIKFRGAFDTTKVLLHRRLRESEGNGVIVGGGYGVAIILLEHRQGRTSGGSRGSGSPNIAKRGSGPPIIVKKGKKQGVFAAPKAAREIFPDFWDFVAVCPPPQYLR